MTNKLKGRHHIDIKPEEHVTTPRIPPVMEDKWREIQSRLRDSLGPNVFNNWFSSLRLVGFSGGKVTLSTPSEFRRDHVATNYEPHLRLHWLQHEPSVRSVEIIVEAERVTSRAMAMRSSGALPIRTLTATRSAGPRAEALLKGGVSSHATRPPIKSSSNVLANTAPNSQSTFDNFVVGASNELAFASARNVAMEPGKRYTALYFHSASGFGKTHLLNAIGNEALRLNPQLKVAYVTAGNFMNSYGQSNRDGDPIAFREAVRSVDMLMLDDLQFICGGIKTFKEFVQTFKALQDAGKQVVIAADRPASELEGIDDYARSCLCGALTVAIMAPDFDMRMAILKRKLAEMRGAGRHIEISESVLDYIARKIESSPRELSGALNCVANNSEVERAETTLEKAEDLIRHLIRATPERRVTIEDIQKQVASFYHVSMRDLLSHRRDRVIVRPRQVAMYLCKSLTTRSLPEIGRKFGGRDHTTVLYGVRRIDEMRKENVSLNDEIDLLKKMIEN